jgi:hypothetical protein
MVIGTMNFKLTVPRRTKKGPHAPSSLAKLIVILSTAAFEAPYMMAEG